MRGLRSGRLGLYRCAMISSIRPGAAPPAFQTLSAFEGVGGQTQGARSALPDVRSPSASGQGQETNGQAVAGGWLMRSGRLDCVRRRSHSKMAPSRWRRISLRPWPTGSAIAAYDLQLIAEFRFGASESRQLLGKLGGGLVV